jgi:ubiquinone/menaquinone biosynthesis C-methylase UbiE
MATLEMTARDDTRVAWDRIAAGYDDAVTSTHFWLGNEGLRVAGLQPGMRFLDVAAGSGALSIPAARLGARVLATDISPAMLDRLGRRADKEGLAVETRVMDGHALDLNDDSFDVAGSQFGVMLFPDAPKGIREMARVVKPGGRVLLNAFGDVRQAEFLGFLARALQAVRPEFTPPVDPPPLPFQFQDADRLRREFAGAGLRDVRIEPVTERMEFETGAALWAWLVSSNPIVESILGELAVTGGERETVEQALERFVRERAGGDGTAVLTVPIHIAVGTK